MLVKVISGGQTGADQAGLRAAAASGLETGGVAPKGWLTEDGPAPWLADYGLTECQTEGYPARTEANVRGSDATLWIGDPRTPGGRATLGTAKMWGKPYAVVTPGVTCPSFAAQLVRNSEARVLNIAGNRESKNPGCGAAAEQFLAEVFRLLRSD